MSEVQEHLILRQKWLKALRSQEYKQCFGYFEDNLGGNCALGVAIRVTGRTYSQICKELELELSSGFLSSICEWLADKYKVPLTVIFTVARMNDRGKSFIAIADCLEDSKFG